MISYQTNIFASPTLGEVLTPVSILREFLELFPKTQKCKAMLLSYFDAKKFYQDNPVTATFKSLAKQLGFCRETISKHMHEIEEMGLIESEKAKPRYATDVARNYWLNIERIRELAARQKIRTYESKNSHLDAKKPATYNNYSTYSSEYLSKEEQKKEKTVIHPEPTTSSQQPPSQPEPIKTPQPKITKKDKPPKSSVKPKLRTEEQREKYAWEDKVGYPHALFIRWRAAKHYKPQGGHWATAAEKYAYSEFYNDPDATTVALYPLFLEEQQTIAENMNQHQANNFKAVVPAYFKPHPAPTEENTQQLKANLLQGFERGAEVALDGDSVTQSTRSAPITDVDKTEILPLPHMVPTLPSKEEQEKTFMDEFYRNKAKWRFEHKREEVREWAKNYTGVVVVDDEGVRLVEDSS